jgi:hypothetical protein
MLHKQYCARGICTYAREHESFGDIWKEPDLEGQPQYSGVLSFFSLKLLDSGAGVQPANAGVAGKSHAPEPGPTEGRTETAGHGAIGKWVPAPKSARRS